MGGASPLKTRLRLMISDIAMLFLEKNYTNSNNIRRDGGRVGR
jgi:hypothetical protein